MNRKFFFLELLAVALFGCHSVFAQTPVPAFTNFSATGNIVLPSDEASNYPAYLANLKIYEQHPENVRDDQLELNPEFSAAYNNRGNGKFLLGDISGAIVDYTKSTALDPEHASAYQNLGFLQNDLSQWQLALQNLYKSLQIDPSLDYSRFYIWSIRSRLGEKEKATKELSDYVKSLQGVEAGGWTTTIGKYLIGTLNDGDFLNAARVSAKNMEVMKERLCQVCYYSGMKHLLDDEKGNAEIFFEKAVLVNKTNVTEYYSAEAELRALKK